MLVLSRKLNEKIQLGDNITVTVLRVQGNTIRLGIDAPRDVRILRGELEPLDNHRKTKDQVFTAIPDNDSADPAPTSSPTEPQASVRKPPVRTADPRAAATAAPTVASGVRPELERALSGGRPLASFVAAHKPAARL